MKVILCKDTKELGVLSANQAVEAIKEAIKETGNARILLSTGASQFPFFAEFVKADIDWDKVEMFHLDEYVGCSIEHPASFKKYLLERFINVVGLKNYHLIDGTKAPEETIAELTALLNEKKVDLGMIGIGENGHIAFNDPPADFEDKNFYKIVNLSDTCKAQQIREGWFAGPEDVFKQAISMTCTKILDCKKIIAVVPYAQKAQAIHDTLTQDVNNMVPATLFKTHNDVTIYVDPDSASMTDKETLAKFSK
jgi:glucosamine-6-phosphate deaminase